MNKFIALAFAAFIVIGCTNTLTPQTTTTISGTGISSDGQIMNANDGAVGIENNR